jgi:DNA-binding NtrC family response regulator
MNAFDASLAALQDPAPNPARNILIVDDEENIRNALRRTLRSEPHKLFFAASPLEGLAIIERQAIDLVISDQQMPEMTGLEFLTLCRDRRPEVIRLMLTGHADAGTAIGAINRGEIYRFLTKPWDQTELLVTLTLAFERQDLERENRRLLSTIRRQQLFIEMLRRDNPSISADARTPSGAFVVPADHIRAVDSGR